MRPTLIPLLALVVMLSGCLPGAEDGRSAFRRGRSLPEPASPALLALGRTLFFDAGLSGDGSRSCASCHNPDLAWGDGLPRSAGLSGKPLPFKTPTLLNLAWGSRMGWDGKFADVDAVAFGPITSPNNMGSTVEGTLARVAATPGYPGSFADAFGDAEVTRVRVEAALGAYVRSLVSGETRFDRWLDGDAGALSASEANGFDIFRGKARCGACHSGWAMSDGSFHDIGTGGSDPGRGRFFPSSAKLAHAWKTPGLREIGKRGPYMHDGSLPDLEAVVDHYDKGGRTVRPSLSEDVRPLGLTPGEKSDLVAFLRTLDTPQSKARPSVAAATNPDGE